MGRAGYVSMDVVRTESEYGCLVRILYTDTSMYQYVGNRIRVAKAVLQKRTIARGGYKRT